jgi:hypothetical protein
MAVVAQNEHGYSVDYIRYTLPVDGGRMEAGQPADLAYLEMLQVVPDHEAFVPTGDPLAPLKFYDSALRLACARVDWHSGHLRQKALVNLSGADCARAAESGLVLREFLAWILAGGGHLTRLDFAVDVFAPVDVMAVKRAWDGGAITTLAQFCQDIGVSGKDGADLGRTIYIGSWESERFVRVYDKAKREGVTDTPWVRIELEAKRAWAMILAAAMARDGIVPAGKALVRDFMTTPIDWFEAAVAGDEGEVGWQLPRRETDRQRWYREQVLPALTGDLRRDAWLRFAVQQALGVTEGYAADHAQGGRVPPRRTRRLMAAVAVLRRELDMAEAWWEPAMLLAGAEWVWGRMAQLGYVWQRSAKAWQPRQRQGRA